MATPIHSLVFGAVFGLALAAPPGPMNAVIAEESVRRGWVAGFAAGLGAMVADLCFLLLAMAGLVAFVGTFPTVRGLMVGAGGVLMLAFAYDAARGVGRLSATAGTRGGDPAAAAVRTHQPERELGASEPAEGTGSRGFLKAFTLALTNPYQIVFWLTVGVKLLAPGTADVLSHAPVVGESLAGLLVVRTGSPTLLVGLFVGITVWIVGFPATLVAAGHRIDRFAPAIAFLSAVVLVLFGVWFLLDAAATLGVVR